LLQVESVVYQVKTGNYVGPNFGRIVKVTENEVTLREIVQDGTGDWAERENSLRLAEGSK
jgi:type IV pilus assembly protein PilP